MREKLFHKIFLQDTKKINNLKLKNHSFILWIKFLSTSKFYWIHSVWISDVKVMELLVLLAILASFRKNNALIFIPSKVNTLKVSCNLLSQSFWNFFLQIVISISLVQGPMVRDAIRTIFEQFSICNRYRLNNAWEH